MPVVGDTHASGGTEPTAPSAPPRRPTPQRRRFPWWAVVLIVAGILAVVMVAFYVPVALTSTSTYCTSCHDMKAAGRSWARSVHSKVTCVQCHVDPGTWNGITWRAQEARNIWSSYLSAGKAMAASVHRPSSAACLKCHDLDKLPPVIDGIKMPHKSHVTMRDLVCADCHTTVSHAPPGQSNATVSMSACSMCHNGETASDACTTCHATPPPANVHPAGFLKTHGQRERETGLTACLRCHHDKTGFCDACHANAPASHFAGDWRYDHGTAAAADRAACLGCHDQQTFCNQCHQVQHPADWVSAHGAVAAKGSAACLVCHPKAMCSACHARMGVTQ